MNRRLPSGDVNELVELYQSILVQIDALDEGVELFLVEMLSE